MSATRRIFVEDGEMGFDGQMIGGDGSGDALSRRFIWERPCGMVDVVTVYAYAVDMWERFNIADDEQATEEACPRWAVESYTVSESFDSLANYRAGEYPSVEDDASEYEYIEHFIGPKTEDEANAMAREWLESIRPEYIG